MIATYLKQLCIKMKYIIYLFIFKGEKKTSPQIFEDKGQDSSTLEGLYGKLYHDCNRSEIVINFFKLG